MFYPMIANNDADSHSISQELEHFRNNLDLQPLTIHERLYKCQLARSCEHLPPVVGQLQASGLGYNYAAKRVLKGCLSPITNGSQDCDHDTFTLLPLLQYK